MNFLKLCINLFCNLAYLCWFENL